MYYTIELPERIKGYELTDALEKAASRLKWFYGKYPKEGKFGVCFISERGEGTVLNVMGDVDPEKDYSELSLSSCTRLDAEDFDSFVSTLNDAIRNVIRHRYGYA